MSQQLDYGSNDASSQLHHTSPFLQTIDKEVEQLVETLKSLTTVQHELQSRSLSDVSLDEVESEVTRLVYLYKVQEVLSIFRTTKKLHQNMESCLHEKSGKSLEIDLRLLQAVDHFQQLVETARQVFSMAPVGNFLRDYVQRMLMFWHEELMKHLAPRFEKLYEAADWPVIGIEAVTAAPTPATSAFDNFFIALLKIEVRDVTPGHQPLAICLPLELMLKPFKKRFHYHFMGTARTNQKDKPEWYLTQVLNWIKDNSNFLSNNVDPLIKLQTGNWAQAKTQLSIGLMGMIKEKIICDLNDLIHDDKNFSHTVDEVYLFLKELKSLLGPDYHFACKKCDIFSVFLEKPYFTKLMNIERKQSSAYVDSILESKSAWSRIAQDVDLEDEEDRKVPEVGDNFIILLQTIIERSLVIQNPQKRQPFVDLVIELIADFHLRLSQLVRSSFVSGENDGCSYWPFSSRYFAIINCMQYLIEVMEDWRCLPFIMESDASEEALQSMILRYQHVIKDTLIPRTIEGFTNELRIRISKFSDVKWFCLNQDDARVDSAECEVLHFVSSALELCRSQLMHTIGDHVIRCSVRQVNDVLMQEVLMKHTFNSMGAERIHKHVHQHLSALFKNFVPKAESYLTEVREITTVLSWNKAVVTLFEEAIASGDPESQLGGLGINKLSLELVNSILSRKIYK